MSTMVQCLHAPDHTLYLRPPRVQLFPALPVYIIISASNFVLIFNIPIFLDINNKLALFLYFLSIAIDVET